MVKWLGQGDFPTEAIDAKHVVWITGAGKIVGDGRVGVHIISSDGGDDCAHLRAWGQLELNSFNYFVLNAEIKSQTQQQ